MFNKDISVGIWVMPNNNLNGTLEDFIQFLVPSDDKLIPIIKNTLQDIEEQNLNPYALKDKSKALIYTWLALQKSPGTTLGQSITKRYLDTDADVCSIFIDWINRLHK